MKTYAHVLLIGVVVPLLLLGCSSNSGSSNVIEADAPPAGSTVAEALPAGGTVAEALPAVSVEEEAPPVVDEATPDIVQQPLPEPIGTVDGPLAVRSVTPSRGLVASNTIVMIEGEGFAPGTQVRFGDLPAKEVQVLTDGILTAMTPVLPIGTVDVHVRSQLQGQVYEVALEQGFDSFMLPAGGRATDTDGDGLSDVDEIAGWDIKVDIFGFGLDPGHFVTFLEHHVASDPAIADTDGDGLSDRDEYFVKSNPTDVDTDGDGLWDGEEWFRWFTSPISIDTDGDARDADPSSQFSTLPPNAGLFDGAELYTFEELAKDPASRGAIKLRATSPTLDDTDGDNVRDFDEIDTPVRTPLLADMPQLLFEIVDNVDIRLDIEYAEEEGRTTAFETSFTTAESTAKGGSQSNTVSASVTLGAEVSVGTDTSASGSLEVTAGFEHGWDTSTESSVSSEQTFAQYEEKSRALTETAATGSMTAGIKVSNIGNITVQVIDLGWTARQWVPNMDANPLVFGPGEYRTFAALGVDLGPGLTLAPGADSGVLPAIAEDINADRVKAFLAKPDSLRLEAAAFELINDQGLNFAFIDEITQARTARVSIDFGNGDFEEYRIATNVQRNADGTLAGITMDKVMDLTVGAGNWEVQEIVVPCTAPANLVRNGGFESPAVEAADGISPFVDDWTSRVDLLEHSGVWPGVVHELSGYGPGDAPEGERWYIVEVDRFENPDAASVGLHQKIGLVADSTTYNYSFWIALGGGFEATGANVAVSLWAGEPEGGNAVDLSGIHSIRPSFDPLVYVPLGGPRC